MLVRNEYSYQLLALWIAIELFFLVGSVIHLTGREFTQS